MTYSELALKTARNFPSVYFKSDLHLTMFSCENDFLFHIEIVINQLEIRNKDKKWYDGVNGHI